MALLLRAPRDFEDSSTVGPGTCQTCGEWLIRYVPFCAICFTPIEKAAPEEPMRRSTDKSEDAVRLVHLSDLHLGRPLAKPNPLDLLRIWLGAFSDAQVDVVVISGDLVQRSNDRKSLAAVRRALEDSSIPFVVVPGNHDVGRPGKHGAFEDVFGSFPRVETHAGVTFLLVDSNAGLPPHERRRHERLFARVVCFVEGRVGGAQLEKLDSLLGASEPGPRVMVLHHHLVPQPNRSVKLGLMFPLQDAHSVRRWAVSRRVALALHGHHHVMRRAGVQSGGLVVLNGGSSTLVGPPYRARIIDLYQGGNKRVIPVELRL